MLRALFILLILFTSCKSNKSTDQFFSKNFMKEILKSVQIIESKYQHQKVIDNETKHICNKGFYYAKNAHMDCNCRYGSKNDLNRSIHKSCNTFFSKTVSFSYY